MRRQQHAKFQENFSLCTEESYTAHQSLPDVGRLICRHPLPFSTAAEHLDCSQPLIRCHQPMQAEGVEVFKSDDRVVSEPLMLLTHRKQTLKCAILVVTGVSNSCISQTLPSRGIWPCPGWMYRGVTIPASCRLYTSSRGGILNFKRPYKWRTVPLQSTGLHAYVMICLFCVRDIGLRLIGEPARCSHCGSFGHHQCLGAIWPVCTPVSSDGPSLEGRTCKRCSFPSVFRRAP